MINGGPGPEFLLSHSDASPAGYSRCLGSVTKKAGATGRQLTSSIAPNSGRHRRAGAFGPSRLFRGGLDLGGFPGPRYQPRLARATAILLNHATSQVALAEAGLPGPSLSAPLPETMQDPTEFPLVRCRAWGLQITDVVELRSCCYLYCGSVRNQ